MKQRRLIDTVGMTARPGRRQDISGEVLPAVRDEARALVPVGEAARALAPMPPQSRPVISITLPQMEREDADEQPVSEYERRKAQRGVTWESDVRVPFAQAVLTAGAFGVMAGLLAWAFTWSWRVPVVVLALAVAIAWLWRLRLLDALLWEVETITQRDVNQDGRIGRPAAGYTVANPHVARQTAARSQRESAAERQRAALVAFTHRCYLSGTSEAAHGVKATGPDREAYVKARDALLSLGIAAWRNAERPRAGWQLAVTEAEAMALLSEHVL